MLPEVPALHTFAVLGLIAVALVLFALERMRLESAALLVFLSLLLAFTAIPYVPEPGRAFDPTDLFAVFGNEALIAVCALMILGKGVEKTQALRPLVGYVSRNWSASPSGVLLGLLVVAAILSAFLNNTPIVAVLLSPLVAIARDNHLSPAKLLMPFGLATIIGGMSTTIGTSTNLLVVTLAEDVAGIEFGMFDFTWFVAIAGGAGLLYLWLFAPALTPARHREEPVEPARDFFATLSIRETSPLAGATVSDLLRATGHTISIEQIDHAGTRRKPLPTMTLETGDELFIRATRNALKDAERALEARLTDLEHVDFQQSGEQPKLLEILVTPESGLIGVRVGDARFGETLGLNVLALHRAGNEGSQHDRSLGETRLAVGDILLCEGTQRQLDLVDAQPGLLPLYGARELPLTRRSGLALLISACVVVVAASRLVPISVAAMTGVGAMLATGCLRWQHVGEALDRQVVLVIVVSLALGKALMATGGDAYLAGVFNALTQGIGAAWVIVLLMFAAALLTNMVTNNAAAVIVVPIAIEIARQSGIDATAVILAVLFGANLSFMTPIGYQTNLLVFSAGGLRFTDFARVGAPLTLLMGGILSALICWRYQLF